MDGIVVGADDTAAGLAAAVWALEEGALRGQPVTVLRAWLDPVTLGYGTGMAVATDLDAFRSNAQALAQDVLDRAGGTATATTAHGRAAQVLCEVSQGAALLVVGTRSAGALSAGILGSVSAAVLHHASCPVVVVPQPLGAPAAQPRVVVGVDHSPSSLGALAWAAHEAELRAWPLVPTVVQQPTAHDSEHLAGLGHSERAALVAAAHRHAARVTVEPEVLTGHPAEALVRLARPGDLLVVGARGYGGFRGLLLGSTSNAVAKHARCAVAVVRPAKPGGD